MTDARTGGTNSDPYGKVTIHPVDPIPAGSVGTWVLTYVVGSYGMDDGGGLKILLKTPADWAIPQFQQPGAPNYASVSTDGAARVRARWETKTHIRPWSKGIVIDVMDGSLGPGETIALVWGDTTGGSPGTQAQSFADDDAGFRVLADCFGTGEYLAVPGLPQLRVVSGGAARLVAIAPSDSVVGASTSLLVRAEDRWGNIAKDYRGGVAITGSGVAGVPSQYVFTAKDGGVHWFSDLKPTIAGELRFEVRDPGSGLFARSNASRCTEIRPTTRLLWGDTQGQTGATVGAGTVREFFAYARDVAGLDFVVHSANDFQVTRQHYEETKDGVRAFHVPGQFVTFLSYEWSGNTPVGGDHNVIFLRDDDAPLHRSSRALIEDEPDGDADCATIADLFAQLRTEGVEAIAVPHVGGRRANVDQIDPQMSPAIEIVSVHGWFEWFAREALARGLKVGFLGASDDHTCRPGASYPSKPEFGVRNGLAGVYARAITREAIWEALRARHCFATTGERIRVMVCAGDAIMGDELAGDAAPVIDVEVVGTVPLESVEIFRGENAVYTYPFPELQALDIGRRLRVSWKGARAKGRNRYCVWDGGLTLEGGRIVAVEPWSFDHPNQGITRWSDHEVEWKSNTSGDSDGVVLTLEPSAGSVLTLEAGGERLRVPLDDLGRAPQVCSLGPVEREVVLQWMPVQSGPPQVRFSIVDPSPAVGTNAYFVRVRQSDGSMAWTSPIFFTFRP